MMAFLPLGEGTSRYKHGCMTASLLPLPATPLAVAALRLATGTESASIANHSVRSYVFAAMLAEHTGVEAGRDVDLELLFVACVLHDIGLTHSGNRHQRFEVDGADVAADFLLQHGVPGREVDQVWEAIALHTSPGIAERRSVLSDLTRRGVGMDFGREVEFITDEQGHAIHAAWPRLAMATSLADVIVSQAQARPEKAPRYSVAAELVRERAAGSATMMEKGAAASRWGS